MAASTDDLRILEEVLNKLHPLVENGKFVGAYKKQLQKFQRNLTIALVYLKEIAKSEKRVDVFTEMKKEVMHVVSVAERQLLLDHHHCPQNSTDPSSPGDGVHVGCRNGRRALWVSVHQHFMARRLCKLNQQFCKLKNQLVGIGNDILMEQQSDPRQQMSGFLQDIALIMIVCYTLAYALSSILIDQSLVLSMQQRSLIKAIKQQIGQILTRIDQLSLIQQRIEG